MADDYSRSIRYIRKVTSRIDKDFKAELRETAFNLWMACYSNVEIAEQVGYSRQAVDEFTNLLQDARNGADAVSGTSSENEELTLVKEVTMTSYERPHLTIQQRYMELLDLAEAHNAAEVLISAVDWPHGLP